MFKIPFKIIWLPVDESNRREVKCFKPFGLAQVIVALNHVGAKLLLIIFDETMIMRWLLFLSRVAFVCNIFFVCSALLQWKPFLNNEAVVSTIVIAGYFLAVFLFSPLVTILYWLQWFLKRNLFQQVPRWLVLVNVLFFVIQIVFIIFYLNDTVHY